MRDNKKEFKSREEKLAFLNGVKANTRSLSEITEPPVIFLVSRDDQPGIVINELTGKVLTIEDAEAIKNKKYVNTIVWVEEKTYLEEI